jgi:hypothetical protein
MGTNGCNEFLDRLDEWMEGERPSDALTHLRDCTSCRSLVDDLDAIRESVRTWTAAEADPPARIWVSLRVELEKEGLIHRERRGWTQGLSDWLGGVFNVVPRPALAGAYLVALIAISIAWTASTSKQSSQTHQWMQGTQISTGPLSARLDTAEQNAVSTLADSNPAVTASLHQNLAIVDNYIALCEKSVREEPENEVARDYLYGAYEQKADLLAQMTERGVNGR